MKVVILLSALFLVVVLSGLYLWRMGDQRSAQAEADRLLAMRQTDPQRFSKAMVEDLPEPARRYFHFTIKEGTPLFKVAEISMRGQFGMGEKNAPNYLPMKAEQVLAAPEGFVWQMSGGSGAMTISGSDTAQWTRFWLAGVIPVARAGGTADHALSGFGRYISEAVFWTPAAVLPGPGVTWDAVDENTARLTLSHDGRRQSVDVSVDASGRPVRIVLERWSNANPDGEYRFQPFGGHLSEFREFEGFRLPTHIEAGNMFGTDAYFAFFIADVTDIRFTQ
ncbi:hypothetical protein SAMN04488030_0890 [Aliiroseovarius halocynthiae]|uniref:Uncharacterized protein n=1 Tax=Aliiroseovarius halocynthiae TaxID=985055 RepID=A0A545SV55_9RHOB|nr:DUF6544 family protein [Aliiroseovarius halocynthiae]TQV68834.1 hypothetical protein FIL88_04430 [Aliiroseovarius halocynthiae]SMR71263.1 hypothetical protein SAMN04488030_0890 [Aliiroseovarius halocynthiae]